MVIEDKGDYKKVYIECMCHSFDHLTEFVYNKDEQQFESSAFSAVGIGVTLQHYIVNADGNNVNNYGFGALVMLDGSQSTAGIGGALTVNFMQFISVGGGYSITHKYPFVITGVQWTF